MQSIYYLVLFQTGTVIAATNSFTINADRSTSSALIASLASTVVSASTASPGSQMDICTSASTLTPPRGLSHSSGEDFGRLTGGNAASEVSRVPDTDKTSSVSAQRSSNTLVARASSSGGVMAVIAALNIVVLGDEDTFTSGASDTAGIAGTTKSMSALCFVAFAAIMFL